MATKRQAQPDNEEAAKWRESAYVQAIVAMQRAAWNCEPFAPHARAILAQRGVDANAVLQAARRDMWRALKSLNEASLARLAALEQAPKRKPALTRKRALKVVTAQA